MEDLIIKGIGISLAIVGLRVVSSKGMILWILRMPYEWLNDNVVDVREYMDIHSKRWDFKDKDFVDKYTKEARTRAYKNKLYQILAELLKPIIGCTTCMASVWTIIIELVYFELTMWSILLIFMVATLNSIIFAVYELIVSLIKHYTKDTCN